MLNEFKSEFKSPNIHILHDIIFITFFLHELKVKQPYAHFGKLLLAVNWGVLVEIDSVDHLPFEEGYKFI